jgi:formate-dependent phosphoribosylglycinamide formyltransferase (GAR transformylase)
MRIIATSLSMCEIINLQDEKHKREPRKKIKEAENIKSDQLGEIEKKVLQIVAGATEVLLLLQRK